MQTETNLNDSVTRRRWAILVGYNLPFFLWTCFALFRSLIQVEFWACPLRTVAGWCPGCGLTRTYAKFLEHQGLGSHWLGVILACFVANGIWSIIKTNRLSGNPDIVSVRH